MVSLWPWRGDDTSPASFERALAAFAGKISKNSSQLDSLRQRSRRFKALWTLYAGFAYILCALILGFVVGWRNWGAAEYGAVAGGPLLIYLVRLSLNTYYDYRISIVTARLEELQRERDKTIEKLKATTKYNTTQELLEKYGGAAPVKPSSPRGSVKKRKSGREDHPPAAASGQQRTGIPPPPTANIPRNPTHPSSPSTPLQANLPSPGSLSGQRIASGPPEGAFKQPPELQPGPPEFAPNAFAEPPQYAPSQGSFGSHWYDRLMNVLLGEDETLPKNRLALICSHCRLVNGQAPPGVKDVAEVGRWRCQGCGGWNGEEERAKQMVHDEIRKQQEQVGAPLAEDGPRERNDGAKIKSETTDEDQGDDTPLGSTPDDEEEGHDVQLAREAEISAQTEEHGHSDPPNEDKEHAETKAKRGRGKGGGGARRGKA